MDLEGAIKLADEKATEHFDSLTVFAPRSRGTRGKNCCAKNHRILPSTTGQTIELVRSIAAGVQTAPATPNYTLFTLPHLNLEDLSNKNVLPVLLNSRVRNYSVAFTAMDCSHNEFASRSGLLVPITLHGWTRWIAVLHGLGERRHGRVWTGQVISS